MDHLGDVGQMRFHSVRIAQIPQTRVGAVTRLLRLRLGRPINMGHSRTFFNNDRTLSISQFTNPRQSRIYPQWLWMNTSVAPAIPNVALSAARLKRSLTMTTHPILASNESSRQVERQVIGLPTADGAGVKLTRVLNRRWPTTGSGAFKSMSHVAGPISARPGNPD